MGSKKQMTINNKALCESLKSLKDKAVPIYRWTIQALDDSCNDRTSYALALLNTDKEVEKLPEFKDCLAIARQDEKLMSLQGKVVGSFVYSGILENETNCILSFLKLTYLEDRDFEQAFFEFEELFYADTMTLEDSVCLYNFNYAGEGFEIKHGLHITHNNIDATINPLQTFHGWPPSGVPFPRSSQYRIERTFKVKKRIANSVQTDEQKTTPPQAEESEAFDSTSLPHVFGCAFG